MIATLDKDSIQKQIDVLEKSLSNAAALKQNETNQNQRTLEPVSYTHLLLRD